MQFIFCKVNAFFKSYNILNAYKTKKTHYPKIMSLSKWALTDSNRRPSACKADALNQLS